MSEHVRVEPELVPATRRRAKTVLMIDYYFPPLAGPGVHRTLGYVNHLAEFGWTPIVLTVQSGEHSLYDVSLLKQISDTVIVQRTASIDPIRFVKRLLTRNFGDRNGPGADSGQSGRPLWQGYRRIRNFVRWFLFPDRRIGWIPFAVARALSVCSRQTVDVIYSTSTVVTSHLIAYLLKKFLGKPWVADFQDPWSENPLGFPSAIHKKVAARLEYLILRDADHVIVTTEPHRRMLQEKFATISPGKLSVIPMGFDAEAFKNLQAISLPKFTITHFGNFYGPRSPGPFLTALGECVKEDPGLAEDVEVSFFGAFDAEMLIRTEQLLERYSLGGIVRLKGVVPYRTGLQYLMSSTLLLLVTDTGAWGRNMSSSKLPEYLAAGRPILALAPDGAITEIVRRTGAGFIVDPDDVEAIRKTIFKLYHLWKKNSLTLRVNDEMVRKFEWRELTGRFVSVLDDVLALHTPVASNRSP